MLVRKGYIKDNSVGNASGRLINQPSIWGSSPALIWDAIDLIMPAVRLLSLSCLDQLNKAHIHTKILVSRYFAIVRTAK